MLLLVGLGNPGPKHARNRHNVGFLAVDAIAGRHGFGPFRSRFHGLAADGRLGGVKTVALKPLTFMNRSGDAVGAALRYYKLAPADVLVIHDELDLAPAKLRMKAGGGHAGHNGLRSVHEHMGPDYRRMRIGIGHPGDKNKVMAYVLSDIPKADRAEFEALIEAIAEAADDLGSGRDSAFASRVALRLHPPKPDAAGAPRGPSGDGL